MSKTVVGKPGSTSHFGSIAWAGLFAYVVAYDVIAMAVGIPTLSSTFHRFSKERRTRFLVFGFWAYLTGHLFRWIPPRYDLFRLLDKPVGSGS